jgi:hypothetical protein
MRGRSQRALEPPQRAQRHRAVSEAVAFGWRSIAGQRLDGRLEVTGLHQEQTGY